jgi:TolB-like protein
MAEQHYTFGRFVLDGRRGALQHAGKPVAIGSRATAILKALLDADGETVSKAQLIECAWPGAAVEDSNLTVQIAALRRALGATPDGQDRITTIPRAGYRFNGDRQPAVRIAATVKPTLAVLPFANIGEDPEQSYFAAGVVEELITALSRFRSFAVVARIYEGPASDVQHVARELGVRYVLEGSVRRVGTRLRITTQLVDGATLERLWARTFDGTLDDVFDFQDRITESVATLVEPRIQAAEIERSRRERPGSAAVYDIYLRALGKISSETEPDNAEAYALLSEGLAVEPDNPLLLSHAAWALEHRHTMGWRPFGPDDRTKCIELARRGLDNAGGDAMVMAHCGMALLQTAREYDWACEVLQAAAASNPNNLLVIARAGVANLHCGSLDEALAYFARASQLSPGDSGAHFALCATAHVNMVRGDYAEAHAWATRALVRNQHFDPTLWILIAANAHLGRMDEARRLLADLQQRAPGLTITRIRNGQPAKDPERSAAILQGLRMAGLPEA